MGIRKCSQCGNTGHNSRTCRSLSRRDHQINGQSMKLFGVELMNLPMSPNHHFSFKNTFPESLSSNQNSETKHSYFSNATPPPQRKKGVPWSEEEHRLFLMGLEKLGKGNWRGISRNFVTTRTSTQVASHAQKYFLRQNKITHDSLSMVRVNEAQSISVGIFSTTDCIYSNRKPINPTSYTLPEIPYNCRFFNNSTPQNTPSLELSLAAPPLPSPSPLPLAWNRRSIV